MCPLKHNLDFNACVCGYESSALDGVHQPTEGEGERIKGPNKDFATSFIIAGARKKDRATLSERDRHTKK